MFGIPKPVKQEWSSCQLDFVKEFILHNESDVAKLPACCVGSKATVSETNNRYVCCKDGKWKLESTAVEEGTGEGSGTGGGDFILELSEDGKTVLTPISEYCAAFREGKTVKINGCYSAWGTQYNLVMQTYSGNPGHEQEAEFSSVCLYNNSVSLFNAEVNNSGKIKCSQKTLAIAT